MTALKNKFIFFDFDGVIVDSFAIAFEVKKIVCPCATEEDYRRAFEGNINDWHKSEAKHDDRCRHDVDFFSEYIPRMKERVKIIPTIDKLIKNLADQYSLIIISSTLSAPISDLLAKYNLLRFFEEIMGNDVHTSKVEKIKLIFSKYSIDAKQCVFITDTLGDIREANIMKVGTIGVSWGFHSHETLKKGNPFRIVDRPDQLPKAVSDFFV